MIGFSSGLEIREVAPIEIPQCEIVLPISRKWFDDLNKYNLSPGASIAEIVAPGSGYVNGPRPREDFASIWNEELKGFSRKIPRKGEVVRGLIPMRRAVLDCLCAVSKEVGESELIVALSIIARALEIEPQIRQKYFSEASSQQLAASLLDVSRVTPESKEPTALEKSKVLPFHKCTSCPHGWKPWQSR